MPQNTVFVVGAGASKEAKLPTGDELKKEISKFNGHIWSYHS